MSRSGGGLAPADSVSETHDFHALSEGDGFTVSANVPGQAVSRMSKAELDAWIVGQESPPAWLNLYDELLADGKWDWRKCLYVAWSCLPTRLRWPGTVAELADLMGLKNTATIRHWRRNDQTIEQEIRERRVGLVHDHVGELLQAAIDCAVGDGKDGHQDRKMLLEVAGIYRPPKQQVESTSNDALRIVVSYEDTPGEHDPADAA